PHTIPHCLSLTDPATTDVYTLSYTTLFRSPGFSAVAWFGLAAPHGTPDAVVEKVQQTIARAFAKPEMQRRLQDLGMIPKASTPRSEEHTSELQSRENLVCRLLLEKKK